MPNHAAKEAMMSGTQMKPAFCSHISPPSIVGLRLAAQPAEDAGGDDQRHQELHTADAEIAEAGIEGERVSLLRARKEEADVRH
ncbi:MAG: hypothetical protein IPO97_09330 [Sphingomonadales bacterium]|nr:hypothetical protein [Sphingomonadales bacterium]